MAPQPTTVCFPAESFPLFPFSLQLLLLCPFLPKWVRQQAGKRRDRLGPVSQHAFLFSPQAVVGAAPELTAKPKALIGTECVQESQNS